MGWILNAGSWCDPMPVVIAFSPIISTFRNRWGRIACWLRRRHAWSENQKRYGRTLTCERCEIWISIAGEERWVAVFDRFPVVGFVRRAATAVAPTGRSD